MACVRPIMVTLDLMFKYAWPFCCAHSAGVSLLTSSDSQVRFPFAADDLVIVIAGQMQIVDDSEACTKSTFHCKRRMCFNLRVY
jgi:hypothetical protein